jgi:hypothetical protein
MPGKTGGWKNQTRAEIKLMAAAVHMIPELSRKQEILTTVRKTFDRFLSLVGEFGPGTINLIPFPGSWSVAQVADHVTKSNRSIARALQLAGTAINRNPFDRVPELKQVFLNFSSKLQSPVFILPNQMIYDRDSLIGSLSDSIHEIDKAGGNAELLEMINHPAFGNITKFEILYFVVFHTQRHLHQLGGISGYLSKIR